MDKSMNVTTQKTTTKQSVRPKTALGTQNNLSGLKVPLSEIGLGLKTLAFWRAEKENILKKWERFRDVYGYRYEEYTLNPISDAHIRFDSDRKLVKKLLEAGITVASFEDKHVPKATLPIILNDRGQKIERGSTTTHGKVGAIFQGRVYQNKELPHAIGLAISARNEAEAALVRKRGFGQLPDTEMLELDSFCSWAHKQAALLGIVNGDPLTRTNYQIALQKKSIQVGNLTLAVRENTRDHVVVLLPESHDFQDTMHGIGSVTIPGYRQLKAALEEEPFKGRVQYTESRFYICHKWESDEYTVPEIVIPNDLKESVFALIKKLVEIRPFKLENLRSQ